MMKLPCANFISHQLYSKQIIVYWFAEDSMSSEDLISSNNMPLKVEKEKRSEDSNNIIIHKIWYAIIHWSFSFGRIR